MTFVAMVLPVRCASSLHFPASSAAAVYNQWPGLPRPAASAPVSRGAAGTMPRSRETSDTLRKKVVEAHEEGKGYKTIGKLYDLHSSTVRKIIYKWKAFNTTATRPRSGRPTKPDASLRRIRRRADNPNKKIAADGGGRAEGTDTESPNVTARTGVEDNIPASMIPAQPNNSEVTRMPKKIRNRIGKTKHLKLASPRTGSSGPAPIIPTPGPAEQHMEAMLCCEICDACFSTEPDLEDHQALHLTKTLHECEECGKEFKSAPGLKTHKTKKHGC